DAISAYSLFIETYPKHDLMPEVLTRLGADFYLLGNFADAIVKYRRILDKFPVKPYLEDALYNIAVCYGKMGRHNEALAMYMDFVARYPKSPRAVEAGIQIGIYYQDQQLWDLAISTFKKALLVNSRHKKEIYFRLGDSYENNNKIGRAMQSYQKIIPMSPKSNIYRITGISQLAAYYERKQQWSLALKMYRDISKNAANPKWRSEAAKRVKLLSQP
ncbi:tetratricopeptide repeat protein, partial [bacterium]|nr:tetratricopeptide repeat protein [bacterium]